MIIDAFAKINWTLHVVGQRADGYHLLDMLMQPVSLCDRMILRETSTGGISLHVSGAMNGGADSRPEAGFPSAAEANLGGAAEQNLAFRAARLLQKETGVSAGVSISLEKRIPSQAGMGGGSADAAGVLLGLNRLWGTGLSGEELEALGLRLGADVPFLIRGGLARCRGIGEMITSFACDRFYPMIVVQPEAGLSTSAVFQAYHAEAERDDFPEKKPEPDRVRDTPSREQSQNAALSAIRNGHPGADRFAFVNALEGVSRKLCPEIGRLVSELSDCGAEIAMMTGSGSAVFGVFTDEALRRQAMERLSPIHRRIWACETRARSVEIWEDA